MEILQSSYAARGMGGTLNVSCYVYLDQAATVYPQKISEVSGIPPKVIES